MSIVDRIARKFGLKGEGYKLQASGYKMQAAFRKWGTFDCSNEAYEIGWSHCT